VVIAPAIQLPLANDINSSIIPVASIEHILARMKRNSAGIRYADLCLVCDYYFGKPRQAGTSHRIYKTPWPGDPRVNIQKSGGMSKPYQVRQVLRAIHRLESENGSDD